VMRRTAIAFLIACLVICNARATIAIVDQQNLNDEGLMANPSTRFSQSFTPTLSSLDAVDVVLFVPGTQSLSLQLSVFMSDGLGGPLKGSTNFMTIPSSSESIPVEFTFQTPIVLQPGMIYTFSIGGLSMSQFSVRYGSDTYAGGQMFDATFVYPNQDLYFGEGLSVPEPGSASFFVSGFFILGSFVWRSNLRRQL